MVEFACEELGVKIRWKILQNYRGGMVLLLQLESEYLCEVSDFSYVEFKIFLKLCNTLVYIKFQLCTM